MKNLISRKYFVRDSQNPGFHPFDTFVSFSQLSGYPPLSCQMILGKAHECVKLHLTTEISPLCVTVVFISIGRLMIMEIPTIYISIGFFD